MPEDLFRDIEIKINHNIFLGAQMILVFGETMKAITHDIQIDSNQIYSIFRE